MREITPRQIGKIYQLAAIHKLDNEALHEFIRNETGKTSVKLLSLTEAHSIIQMFLGEADTSPGMMTTKQWNYIKGMMANLGWVDEKGKADESRFLRFVKEKFRVERKEWITAAVASNAIEAFKEMLDRRKEGDNGSEKGEKAHQQGKGRAAGN